MLQLCVLLYESQSTLSSLHFYFKWKKNESHSKDVKSCLQNYLPKQYTTFFHCIFIA